MGFAVGSPGGLYTQSMDFACPTVTDEDPRPWLELRRTLNWRQQRRNSQPLLELIAIAVVLVVSVASAWWVASECAFDLSGLAATVEALTPPRGEPEHHIVGYTTDDHRMAANPS